MEMEIDKCLVLAVKLIQTLESHYVTLASLLSLAVGYAIALLHALNACQASTYYHQEYASVRLGIWFLEFV